MTILAVACNRTGIRDRAPAFIVSTVLEDVTIANEADPTYVLEKLKLERSI